ncbi:hypothetical protein MPSEU_000311900 [Mayamaea pseudoterrestris]|nr:hypothetical protein MPSEU_000311900 [Mayamaea pseudoterrestris]
MSATMEQTSPNTSPASPISDSGESCHSNDRRNSWKEKLSPYMPKRNSSRCVQLELQNSIDDDLLVVLKQVVRTILEQEPKVITKSCLYRVLRKFARSQVDLKSLETQLIKTTRELHECQMQLAVKEENASETNNNGTVAATNPSAQQRTTQQQIIKLQQMIIDLEEVHTKQRQKYEQALRQFQQNHESTRQSLDTTSRERNDIQSQLEQERIATAVGEQVIQALRETLLDKDECIKEHERDTERLQMQLTTTMQAVAERDETIELLQKQINEIQVQQKAVGATDEAQATGKTVEMDDTSAHEAVNTGDRLEVSVKSTGSAADITAAIRGASLEPNGYEVHSHNGKEGGFMLSRINELEKQRLAMIKVAMDTSTTETATDIDERIILQRDSDDSDKPWRVDELRKRRDTQEKDVKQQLFRINQRTSTSGQATAQSPDRDSGWRSAPNSPSDRNVATLKTHVAVQEALVKERDATIEELQAQVQDLSSKLDATVALTASLVMRDRARTIKNDGGQGKQVDAKQVDELQRSLKHSEAKVAKLKQELTVTKRNATNSEQKIKLLETFIMEDLHDEVVLGEVTESQKRRKTIESFEESTRSILDESQMLAIEKASLKTELYDLKSQLRIAQAMVSDLEKDRKSLRSRIAHIDPLGEITEKADIEAKVYELALELADVTVERDALAEELHMGKQRIIRLEGECAITRRNSYKLKGLPIMADLSEAEESFGTISERSTRLSFFSGQEEQVSPGSPPCSRDSAIREGICSLFAPEPSSAKRQSPDVKQLEQRIADLEAANNAYAASVDSLKSQLNECMFDHSGHTTGSS